MTIDRYMADQGDESRVSWLNGYREKWMNDDQWLCYLFLGRVYKGFHHLHGIIRASGRKGVCINTTHHTFATTDFDTLTKAVIMAHNWCVRFEITSSGPGMLKLFVHKRSGREGCLSQRHPTIDQAIEKYKEF